MKARDFNSIIELVKSTSRVFEESEMEMEEDVEEQFKSLSEYTTPISMAEFENNIFIGRKKKETFYENDYINERRFGLDASSIREVLHHNYSVLFSIAQTRIGITGESSDIDLQDKSLITSVYYVRDNEVNTEELKEKIIKNADIGDKSDYNIKFVKDVENENKAGDFLKNVVIPYSESNYLRELSDKVKDNDSILLDGTVLPTGIMKSSINTDYYKDHNGEWKGIIGETIDNYMKTYKNVMDKEIPFFSIVKNISSRELVKSIESSPGNEKVKWSNDNIFLSYLLDSNKGELTYTNWFKEDKLQESNKSQHEEMLSGCEDYDYYDNDYRRIFFYVKLPNKDTVSRVETISGLINNKDTADKVRDMILKEIAISGDIPEPILEADEEARIDRDTRQKLKNQIYKSKVNNYNNKR